jgi:3-hydroxyacyl-CoA dehydrogenase
VDAITGPLLGRPKSATFRTLDLAGVDVLRHVVQNLHERLTDPEARAAFVLPAFVERMLERGLTGEKGGGGFYRRVRKPSGESDILVLDPATLEYRAQRTPRIQSLDAARAIPDVRERVRRLVQAPDRAGAFLRDTLLPTLTYTARIADDIAYSRDDIDRVMRWGFGWELGPFELAEAIGANDSRPHYRSVRGNAAASLVDLGDGVLCVEFHSKMNVIGPDTLQILQAGIQEASANFAALVIGNEAEHFTAGADLALALGEARKGNWNAIDAMIRSFQEFTLSLRYADVPVVVAPAGLALGGGCEMALHADRVQAAAECYIGLSETAVGLIPAGGGTKEMTARAAESMAPGAHDPLPPVQRAFETMAFARVSTSAPDARRLGYLRPVDGISMNRERLIADAKARALERVREGYQPPPRRRSIPVGGDAVLAPLKLGVHLAWRAGRISDHDALIGRTLAAIMAGGSLPHPTSVDEQHLLDLEREAFLRLLGEPKTQERIEHTLRTGKPLRN